MATVSADELLEQLMALPREERRRVLDEADMLDLQSGGELSPEWLAEIDRRVKMHESGEAKSTPFPEAMARMRAELKRRREARSAK